MNTTMIFFFQTAISALFFKPSQVQIEVKECAPLSSFTGIFVEFDIINNSNRNYLFYALTDTIEVGQLEEKDFCSKNIGVGICVLFFDREGKLLIPEIRSGESHDNVFAYKEQALYKVPMNSYPPKIVVKRETKTSLRRTVRLPIESMDQPWYFKIVYFAGENLPKVLYEDVVEEDEKSEKARVYNGCIKSDLVKLCVDRQR